MRKKKLGLIFVILFFGTIIGSALGSLIAYVLPEGVVKQFFLRSVTIGFDPVTLNLGILNFTMGFNFILNVIGVVSFFFVAYFLKWYYGNRL
ncbi:hypothetical protein B6I21_00200 [candidate division KSB1 bacterium 4572_119]|nr:MAG: hypothetical protein B6I21_00200 [candidate division KSB1 bacterium 4572_119]